MSEGPPRATIIQGEVSKTLRDYPDAYFDGCFSDPPYFLGMWGASWDEPGAGSAYALHSAWAKAVYRVLRPGAYLLAFSSPRTMHHLMCALEDSGFELRDTLCWVFATGYPKGKASLKPAWEPLILARKPARLVVPLNIDECRIGTGEDKTRAPKRRVSSSPAFTSTHHLGGNDNVGRWPANILFDEEAGRMLDAQSGVSKSPGSCTSGGKSYDGKPKRDSLQVHRGYGDKGGASRFFFCSKAPPKEKLLGKHPTQKPLDLCEWAARLIRPSSGGRLLVPFAGSGSEVLGALHAGWSEVLGIEQDASYAAIARARVAQ